MALLSLTLTLTLFSSHPRIRPSLNIQHAKTTPDPERLSRLPEEEDKGWYSWFGRGLSRPGQFLSFLRSPSITPFSSQFLQMSQSHV